MEIEIVDTTETLSYWKDREFLSDTTKALLVAAEVLIVPEEGFRDYRIPVFPRNTIEPIPTTVALFKKLKR